MATARAIIIDALTDLGVLDATETPEQQDIDLGLRRLNQLIGQLALQRLTMFEVRREVFDLAANTASYTIGPTGTWATVRPNWIEGYSFIQDKTAAQPVETPRRAPLTIQEWQAVGVKATTSTVPYALFYDHAFSGVGLGACTVYPVPTTALPQVVLYLPRPMQQFATAATDYALPDGWEEMLVKQLALRLQRPYGKQADPGLLEEATVALNTIKSANRRPRLRQLAADALAVGGGGGSRYNIYTDV